MTLFISETVKSQPVISTPYYADSVHSKLFLADIPSAGLAASDIVEVAVLPARCRIVGAVLVALSISETTVKGSVGIMSGEPGAALNADATARTVGTEIFAATALASSYIGLAKADALVLAPKDGDQGIGIKVDGAIAAGAGKKLGLLLHYVK